MSQSNTTSAALLSHKDKPESEKSSTKNVSFSHPINAQVVDAESPLTLEEVKSSWYNFIDMVRFKVDAEETAELFAKSSKPSDVSDSTRGLEVILSNERKKNIDILMQAVLRYQHQLEVSPNKVDKSERLARLSAACSHRASDLALEAGISDYKEVYGKESWFRNNKRMNKINVQPFPFKSAEDAIKKYMRKPGLFVKVSNCLRGRRQKNE